MRAFISADDIDDPLAHQMMALLRASLWEVTHSPRNPDRGPDERWANWYGEGCASTLALCDLAVGVVTAGWDGSTWMCHEGEEALNAGVPLFIWNPRDLPIPLGMRRYAKKPLPNPLVDAIAALEKYREAPEPPLERHLRRLARFLDRLPNRPSWTKVVIGEDVLVRKSGALEGAPTLFEPSEYYSRFDALLQTRAWVATKALPGAKGCDVTVQPFTCAPLDGVTFGLVPRDDGAAYIYMPFDLAFFPPWDGTYST